MIDKEKYNKTAVNRHNKLIPGVLYDEPNKATNNLIRGVLYDVLDKNNMLVRGVSYDKLEEKISFDSDGKDTVQNVETQNSSLQKFSFTKSIAEYEDGQEVLESSANATSNTVNKDKVLVPQQKTGKNDKQIALSASNNGVSVQQGVCYSKTLNFDLYLEKIIIQKSITEEGEKDALKYVIAVQTYARKGTVTFYKAIVDSDKVKSVEWLKKATFSQATLPKGKDAQEEFQVMVQNCIETDNVPLEIIFPNAGWYEIQNVGWRYAYSEGIVGEKNPLFHAPEGKYHLNINADKIGKIETFNYAVEMMNICRYAFASTNLFLFVHATVLETLFEKAGYPIHFVFGITGVTNSRKTSLALTMAKIFNRDKMLADAEFATATECGIEKTLSMYKDSVVIIDDFKPGVNRTQQRIMDQKLDQLVRLVGNRVPKKRMTEFSSNSTNKYFPIQGGCVITMEMITGVTSSISRMFLTELSYDDVDNDKLSFYQKNIWILPTHLYDYISWVTKYFNEIVKYIEKEFPNTRTEKNFKIERFNEMYAVMKITSVLFSLYARDRKFWNDSQLKAFEEQVSCCLEVAFKNMEGRFMKRDKANAVLEILRELLDKKKIIAYELTQDTSGMKADFYQDDCNIYVRAKALRQVVNEYCRQHYEYFEIINEEELISIMDRVQILDVRETKGKRECSRKLPIQKQNALRYLYVKKDRLHDLLGV